MSKKILFMTRGKGIVDMFWSEEARKRAQKYGYQVDIPAADGDILDFDFTPILSEYDGLITSWGSPMCSKEFLSHAPNVKVIGHSAGSVAAITDATTYECDVHVTSANPVMAEAVAEWCLLGTLLAARDFWKYAQWKAVSPMIWGLPESEVRDITQLTVGIWGMGDTTKHLLRMLKPLRIKRILVASNHSSAEELAQYDAEKGTFEEVFSQSDIIHCLVGVNKENLYRVDSKVLSTIKDGATLLNCGRAKLFKEQDLLDELAKKRFTAMLDVFHQEPLPQDSPLRKLDNVILTPHCAGYTGRNLYIPFLFDQFEKYFTTGKMDYEISLNRYLTQTNERLG